MTDTVHEVRLLGDWSSWNPESLPISAWNHYVPFGAWLFENLTPRLSVELGTGAGESFRALCQIASHFTRPARCVGIDPWDADPELPWNGTAAYEVLTDYCVTRHSELALLLRMQFDEAVGEFDDASIGLLHVARGDHPINRSPGDLALWLPKMQPGGVILVSDPSDGGLDETRTKVWQHLAETYPAVPVGLPGFVGLAQVPLGGEAPLVEFLREGSDALGSLFRALGERVDYRHVLGSDPVSSGGLRRHIAALLDAHAEDNHRSEARYQATLEARDEQLASVYERLITRSGELAALQTEGDFLLAKLAAQAAKHERDKAMSARQLDELKLQIEQTVAESSVLRHELADRKDYIDAMMNSRSWRLTKSLRTFYAIRTNITRRARRT